MPNTYYDSALTGEQIEAALTAIDGVVTQENNGKVLAIEAGKIVAKSASEWTDPPVLEPLSVTANGDYTPSAGVDGFNAVHVAVPGGGGGTIEPLSVTANGTYNPPSGVDGYAPVTVQVSGGGGKAEIKTVNVINSGNKLIEFETPRLENDVSGLEIINPADYYVSARNSCIYADNAETNKDQTIYAVVKSLETGGNYQGIGSCYVNSSGNAPNIFTDSSEWITSVYGNDTSTGVTSTVFHVLTIALDATAKRISYYIDGVAHGTKTFSNCGRYPSIGGGTTDGTTVISTADMAIRYGAIVSEAHDSATVIANHQLIMQRYAEEIGT